MNTTKIKNNQSLRSRLPAWPRLMVVVVMSVVVIGVLVSPVSADLRSDITALEARIAASQAEANRLGQEANSLQNELNRLSAEKAVIQGQIDLNQAKYEQLVTRIADNERKMKAQQKVMSDAIGDLSIANTTSPIELLASSNSIGDYIDQQEYSSSIRDQLETSIDLIKKLKAELSKQKKEVEAILSQQKIQRDELAHKESEQAELVATTRSQEANYQALVGDLQQQKAAAEAALARSLNSGSYKVAPVGPIQAGGIVGSIGSTGMSTGPHLHLEVRTSSGVTNPSPYIQADPVNMPPAYVSQAYGNRDPMYVSGYHPGTDYAANYGAPIFAIANGYMYRGCSSQLLGTYAYGYVAIIEHADGTRSIYAHMSGGPSGCSG